MKLKILNEVKIGRVWQLIENPKYNFGIISASTLQNTNKENEEKTAELLHDIRSNGYGFIHLIGGWFEGMEEFLEPSFLVHGISKSEVIDWGIKYQQNSVLFKDEYGFLEISTSPKTIGTVLKHFNFGEDNQENITFAAEIIKNYYSRLKYGKHKNKKFSFIFKEQTECNWISRMGQHLPEWKVIFKEN